MKLISIIFTAILFSLVGSCFAQAFTNLNFESANIPNSTLPNTLIPISAGLPGWNGYFISSTATNQVTQVSYDEISLGGNIISVIDANAPIFPPLQGNYSAFLFGGAQNGVGGFTQYSATISQTGVVPTGTESLLLDAYVSGASFIVTLGGQTINMTPLQTFSNYTLYGGNISSFAGDLETLSFTEPPATTGADPGMFELDNIVFSPSSIPEPSEFALAALGALFLGFCRRKR